MRLTLNYWLSGIILSFLGLAFFNLTTAQSLDPTIAEDDFFTEDFIEPVSNETVNTSRIAAEADIEKSFSVTNTSQQNKDAQAVGANEGDVLRYEFKIKSDTSDVKNFLARIDIASILKNAEIIDKGLAQQQGNQLIFPSFSQAAPCEKVFTFFVRVKKCNGEKVIATSGHGLDINVPLSCELNQTGPAQNTVLFFAFGIVIALLFFFGRARRKN